MEGAKSATFQLPVRSNRKPRSGQGERGGRGGRGVWGVWGKLVALRALVVPGCVGAWRGSGGYLEGRAWVQW